MRYTIHFGGRKKGAIGIMQSFTAIREAENQDAAVLALYDEYQDISFPRIWNEDKGQFGGSCNREACQKPEAIFFNRSTQKYYCGACARILNEANKYDTMRHFGPYDPDLCVSVQHPDHPHHT